jgi:UDP-N-acetylglucosamine:LPS N-acetylglucosamine transferase
MKKVYFMIYDMGGGHRSTANALKEAIAQQGLPWQVEIVEVLREVLGITFPQFFYNHWVLKQKWAKVINDPISVPIFKLQIRLLHRVWLYRLRQYWREQQPDLVVSLMPLVNRVLCESLQLERPDTPFVTSITDFADCPPHFWIETQEQFLICPSQRAIQQAKAVGYPDEKLFQTSGVVIHPRFNQPVALNAANSDRSDRQIERQRLGLHPDLPTGLITFGSHGSKEMIEIADRLEQSALNLQLIFICGRNQDLAKELRQRPSRFPQFVEGFTSEIPFYMHLADFFIGKPGSVGISEAIAMKLPVITECHPVMTLFQERASADWLAENEFGLVVRQLRDVPDAVAQLIQPETFSHYRANVEAYQNQAVFEVVRCLENILETAALKTIQEPLLV